MADLNKIITDKIREAEKSKQPSYDPDRAAKAKSYTASKNADKLMGFAKRVIQEFAKQVGKVGVYTGKRSSYGDCKANFEIYNKNFWGAKTGFRLLEITVGREDGVCDYPPGEYSRAYTLLIDGRNYGDDLEVKDINEEWFVTVLAQEYTGGRR